MSTMPAARAFVRFLDEHDISLSKAATELHCSKTLIISWRAGRLRPSDAHKEAIEKWTAGTVKFEGWLTAREKKLRETLSTIRPFRSAA